MERSEIVFFVQVAGKVVFQKQSALHGFVAVLFAYLVNCTFEFIFFSVGFVKKTYLHFVFVGQSYRPTVIARSGSLKL